MHQRLKMIEENEYEISSIEENVKWFKIVA